MPSRFAAINPWSWYMATTTPRSRRPRCFAKNVSAGYGPSAAMPFARAAAMAGRITRCSSSPKSPSSPACGFRPSTATARFGPHPKFRSAAAANSSVRVSGATASASGTSRSARWTVARRIRNAPPTKSIFVSGTPASAPRNSVWPGCGYPAARSAIFEIGAVTIPSARPASARPAATSIARAAERPDAAVGAPGSTDDQPSWLEAMTELPGDASSGSNRSGSTGSRSLSRARRAARSSTSGSPTATRRARRRSDGDASERATISGPTPAGSTMVRSRMGRRAATSLWPSRLFLDLDVDGLLDPVVPAFVGVFQLLVLRHALQVVLDLVVFVLRFGHAAQHFEDVVARVPFEGRRDLAVAERGQDLAHVGREAGNRHLAQRAGGVARRRVHRITLRHRAEVGSVEKRVAKRQRPHPRPILV